MYECEWKKKKNLYISCKNTFIYICDKKEEWMRVRININGRKVGEKKNTKKSKRFETRSNTIQCKLWTMHK